MSEILSNFSSRELIGLMAVLIGLVAVLGGLVVGVVAIIAHHRCRVRVVEIEANLKQQMLEKGMSAAEIDQVIKAGQEPRERHCAKPW